MIKKWVDKKLEEKRELLDEFCNDPAEVHATMHGVYEGIIGEGKLSEFTMSLEDVKNELHYARFGFVVGRASRRIAEHFDKITVIVIAAMIAYWGIY